MENNNVNNILDNKYTLLRKIHKDSFFSLYLVKDIQSNIVYIAKIFHQNINYERELELNKKMKKLNNPYILNLVSYGTNENNNKKFKNCKYIIFNNAAKGDLLKYVYLSGGFSDELYAKIIFLKILKTIQAIHKIGIYHLDIKLDNIFLDENYNPLICNFNFSKTYEESQNGKFSDIVGTPGYMPPQMYLKNTIYDGIKSDIFSLGVTLFTLVTNVKPFSVAKENDKNYRFIHNYKIKNLINFWKQKKYETNRQNLSESFKQLFIRLVSLKEEDRPTINEIINNKWFDEINNLDEDQRNIMEEKLRLYFCHKENVINCMIKQNDTYYLNIFKKLDENKILDGIEKTIYFKLGTNPKIEESRKKIDNYIKINDTYQPLDLMNTLANKFKLYGKIDASETNLKFNIIIENNCNNCYNNDNNKINENNNEIKKELIIQVKLFKCINDGFFLRFTKKAGDLTDYYIKSKEIMKTAHILLYTNYKNK